MMLVSLEADGIIEVKMAFYQSVVMEVHAGGKSDDYLTGGADGHEDIAFFQYRAYYKWWDEQDNVSRTRDIYILYSEDDQCDIEDYTGGFIDGEEERKGFINEAAGQRIKRSV